jgi:hypothetical protein
MARRFKQQPHAAVFMERFLTALLLAARTDRARPWWAGRYGR